MGDNREHSADGRFWGFVPRQNIMGRPLFNYWSYETTSAEMEPENPTMLTPIGSFLSTAIHIPTRTSWDRTFHLIK